MTALKTIIGCGGIGYKPKLIGPSEMCTKEIFCWMIFHQFRYEIPKSKKKRMIQTELLIKSKFLIGKRLILLNFYLFIKNTFTHMNAIRQNDREYLQHTNKQTNKNTNKTIINLTNHTLEMHSCV